MPSIGSAGVKMVAAPSNGRRNWARGAAKDGVQTPRMRSLTWLGDRIAPDPSMATWRPP